MEKSKDRSEFGERLFRARKHAGLSQAALAKAVGMSQGSLAEAERIGQGSSLTSQIASATGVNAVWLATGAGEMSPGLADDYPQPIDMDAHPDLVPIRKVRLKLRAGVSGFAVDVDEADSDPIFFRSEWLRARGYKPYNLIATKVGGNSMEPTLFADDVVVANTADIEPKDGKVFAVNYEGEAVIKRMVRDGGSWWLSSDNPDQRRFPRKECVEGSCIVVGRIVHRQSEEI